MFQKRNVTMVTIGNTHRVSLLRSCGVPPCHYLQDIYPPQKPSSDYPALRATASWSPLVIGGHHQGMLRNPWLHHCPWGEAMDKWRSGRALTHTALTLINTIWSLNFECVKELAINICPLPANHTLPALKKEDACEANCGSCSTATVRHL